MVLNRKFTIWLVSFAVVLAAFLLYRSASNTGVIEITTLDQSIGRIDANQFMADSNAGQVGRAKVEYVERARFETVDAKTRKLKRVVGFEKVLHKSGNEWLLDKPYMNIFQGKMRADITSDTGTIEIENVQGSSPIPKSAVLKGNVVIHIMPETVASKADSFVYLKQITFDSDRSMFYSEDDVNFISADAHLMGKGLEVVYNSITNKLEYLKVKTIDYLNVRGLAQVSEAKETQPKQTQPKEAKVSVAKVSSANSVEIKPVEIRPAEVKPAVAKIEEKKESYQCLFRDNARLEHRNEVVLADEIAITDILQPAEEESEKPQTSVSPVEPNIPGKATAKKPQVAGENKANQKPAAKPQDIKPQNAKPQNAKAIVPDENKPVVATVKCDGPMIIRPDSEAESDDYKLKPFKKYRELAQTIISWLGRRNVLIAQRVSYDYTNQVAKAHGKVELVFYPAAKSYSANKDLPFTIDAQKGAEFITAQSRAIFSGDVKGSLIKQTDYYDEENTFHGDKLVVDLTSGKSKPEAAASSNISHITVTGPGVRLESIRTADDAKLSHIRLKSKRIDYDKATEEVIATGKGIIEYSNKEVENPENSSSKSALSKPCFAIIEGFDKLVWDTNSLQLKAFSDKTRGVHIGYLPIVENGYGDRITVDTRQVEINYFEPTAGKAQLKNLYATGGIVYYEQPKFEFVGKDLYYDAQKEYMNVNGDKDMPCMLNGAMADGIEYNTKTGAANAILGKGIGIIPVKE